ncbi:MAG: histidinol dehydrogenase [Oscillospiraceae bacterium]|nr:histidinol dehydrogenase [Oscillospiraceae bacterium]
MINKFENENDFFEFTTVMSERGGVFNANNTDIKNVVIKIIDDIVDSDDRDETVKKYTTKFDCPNAKYYDVPEEVIKEAYNKADTDFIDALKRCKENIETFHIKQKREGYTIKQENGVILKQIIRPLKRVGIYVPGGTAAYPSSVLMNAIPAKIAGVKEIIMVTPPQKDGTPNPNILAAAKLCGIDKIFLCGGTQAIAALTIGTEKIPSVDKIVGPGNIYVATAKKILFGLIDIDMIAGPSEIMIIADETANPVFVAADLLSQAEHDVLASAVLITTSEALANAVTVEIEKQLSVLPRKNFAEESLKNYGAIFVVNNIDEAVKWANLIAPEHLEVMTKNPLELEEKLVNYGSLFLGEYSPEPLGDYFAGPNHVLPTNGTARFSSPLSVDDFIKKSSSIYYTKEALKEAADAITLIAGREGLEAHANSIKVRCEN